MIFDIFYGDLQLSWDDFKRMPYCEFDIRVRGLVRARNEQWRHTRLLLAVHTGKDPRHIIPLPGDWDKTAVTSKEKSEELSKAWAKQLEQLKKKNNGKAKR